MERIKEQIKEFKDKNVKFIRPIFVDILGRMLDFTIPIEDFEDLIKNGKGFDGSSVEGFARTEESDLRFIPDINTLTILPWEYKGIEKSWREAIVFGHIIDSSGKEYEGDTRSLLKNIIEKYEDIGTLKCGAEIEFFIFENDKSPRHTDEGGYFRSGLYGEIRKEAQLALNEMGIKTEFDHHEVSPSQHEIDLTYTNALKMADSIILTKYVVKRIICWHIKNTLGKDHIRIFNSLSAKKRTKRNLYYISPYPFRLFKSMKLPTFSINKIVNRDHCP